MPEISEILLSGILGSNVSLDQIRTDLELPEELPGYGIQVAWESERPELLSSMGLLNQEGLRGVDPSRGETFSLMAELSCGEEKELVTVPITVLPEEMTQGERLAERIDSLALEDMENETVRLMEEFEGVPITYRRKGRFQNAVLLVLGGVLAACLWMKEKNDEQLQKKRREESSDGSLSGPGLRLSGTDRGRLFHPPGLEKDSPGPETVGDASVFRGLPGNAGHVEPDGDGDAGRLLHTSGLENAADSGVTRDFPVFWRALCAQVEAASEASWSRKWKKPLRYRRTWPGERGRRHLQSCCFPCLGCSESLW